MNLRRRIENHFEFDAIEKRGFLITSFFAAIVGFMFVWRVVDFGLITGILNFILLFVMSLFCMFIFIGGTKIVAIIKGYTAHYSFWPNGLLVGFLISFISYGYIPVFFPGMIEIHTIERLRRGKLFFGENKANIFFVLLTAPLLVILFGLVLMELYLIIKLPFLYYGTIICAIIAFFSMIPLPQNIGSHILYTNRKMYGPTLLFTLLFFLAVIVQNMWLLLAAVTLMLISYFVIARLIAKKL